MKKVLITGVSGIVGSSVYLHLRRMPHRYELYGLGRRRALSARVTDRRDLGLPESHHFICDVADYEGVARAVHGMDTVVHLAAVPYDADWNSLLHSNIIGDHNVFEACRQAGVRRVVAASTIQVSFGQRRRAPYSAVSEGLLEELPPDVPRIDVSMAPEPLNLYASTKVFTESLCRVFSYQHAMSCLAIRIGWVVSEDRPPNRRAVDTWCSQRDIAGLTQACIDAPEDVRFDIFYAVSNNRHAWVNMENARERLGFVPQDRAEDHELPD